MEAGEKTFEGCRAKFDTAKVISLWENDFTAERKHWQEAMLSAAIWFLVSEIGVNRIYHHTDVTGCYLEADQGNEASKIPLHGSAQALLFR